MAEGKKQNSYKSKAKALLEEFSNNILKATKHISRYKSVDHGMVSIRCDFKKAFVDKKVGTFVGFHNYLFMLLEISEETKKVFPAKEIEGICQILHLFCSLAETALICVKTALSKGDTDEAMRYIYHAYVALNGHNDRLKCYATECIFYSLEDAETSEWSEIEFWGNLAYNLHTLAGLIRLCPEGEEETEDRENCEDYMAMTYFLEITYQLCKVIHTIEEAKQFSLTNPLVRETKVLLTTISQYVQMCPKCVLENYILNNKGDMVAFTVGRAFTSAKKRCSELEDLASRIAMSTKDALYTSDAEKEQGKTGESAKEIPPERRTAPLSLSRMAQYWGGEMTAKKLRAMIGSGSLKAIQLNRQTFVFDTEYLPAEVIKKAKR